MKAAAPPPTPKESFDVEDGEEEKASKVSKVEAVEVSRKDVFVAVALYAACSSTLLLINSVTLRRVKDSSFVLACQFIFSSVTCRILRAADIEKEIEPITWEKGKSFFIAVVIFFICLLSCAEALKSVNAETVIVARSCAPIAVALLEHATLGRALPSLAGTVCLMAIALGAFIYVYTDQGFQIVGYSWLVGYYVIIVIDMVFVKYVVDSVPMTTWTRVYYNNTLSIPLVFLSSSTLGMGKFTEVQWTLATTGILLLSCCVGVVFSWAGFHLRKLFSATSFTVVGVLCKIITVLLNDMIWENHSNFEGHCSLFLCIAAGFMYERTKGVGK